MVVVNRNCGGSVRLLTDLNQPEFDKIWPPSPNPLPPILGEGELNAKSLFWLLLPSPKLGMRGWGRGHFEAVELKLNHGAIFYFPEIFFFI